MSRLPQAISLYSNFLRRRPPSFHMVSIKALFSIRPNGASNTLVSDVCFFLTDAYIRWFWLPKSPCAARCFVSSVRRPDFPDTPNAALIYSGLFEQFRPVFKQALEKMIRFWDGPPVYPKRRPSSDRLSNPEGVPHAAGTESAA